MIVLVRNRIPYQRLPRNVRNSQLGRAETAQTRMKLKFRGGPALQKSE
jgi:hypothetical protein